MSGGLGGQDPRSSRVEPGEPAPGRVRRAVRDSGWRASRRDILRAGATFGALAAAGGVAQAGRRPALAQDEVAADAPQTLAGTWVEAEQQAFAAANVGQGFVVPADFPFYAVGVHWAGEVGTWPTIELAFSWDGATFTEPVSVNAQEVDAGRPDRDGRIFTDLAFADGGASFVQYRVLDQDGNPASAAGLALTYIDASAGPTVDEVFSPAALPALQRPPIISRAGWGANEGYRYDSLGVGWTPEYREVRHAIIHHTVTPNFQDPLVAIRSIYYYHAVTRGWGDIGYNYLVDFMGNVYEGRWGGENVVGGHAYQYAYGSAGVGAMGRFGGEDTTPEMQAGLVWITAWLTRNLDPYGTADFHEMPNLPTICAHRDVNQTDCPGDLLYDDLQTIRNYVSAVLYEGHAPGPAAGEFAPGDVVEVVVDGANLRSSPGLDGWIMAELPLGTVLQVADGPTTTAGYVWYQVAGAAGTGWSASFVFRRTDQAPPPIAGKYAVGDEVVVATDALKMRDAPALSGGVLAILPTGTAATIAGGPSLADGYSWYELASDYGIGWSVGEFLARPGTELPPPPDAAFAVGDAVAVDTDALNLRTAPSLDAGVVAVLPTGATGTVLAGPEWGDGTAWYRLETRLGTGWSVGGYLVGAEPSSGGAGESFAVGDRVVVATDALNLRSGPATGAAVRAVLPTGTRLTVVGGPESADGLIWFGVESAAFGAGWCAGRYLEPDANGDFASGEVVRVVDGALNLRSEPRASAPVLAVMPDGTQLTIDYGPSRHDGYDWWYVDGPFGGGWCVGAFLVPA